jgi:enoyl-CoA hydratase/carnithine racemase
MSSETKPNGAQAITSREEPSSEILTERSAGILRIQLNRPAKKNALTSKMYSTLADLLNGASKDEDIRVVVLHGAGDSFCAGNDLADFLSNPPKPGESAQERFVRALINCEKPLVAAIHGATVGSGMTMLIHCDFVYAAESTKLQFPFINLAVVPELGSSYLVPAAVGYLRAAELFLLGTPFDGRRAEELGLVTRVVAENAHLTTALATARALAEKPPAALLASKRLLKRGSSEQLETALSLEGQEFGARVRSAEAREAMTAFLEKRRPDFTKSKSSPATH